MAVRPGLGRRRYSHPFLSVAVLGLMLASGSAISSESLDEQPETATPEVSEINTFLERKTEREEELAALSRDIDVSSDRQAAIAREIRALDRDRETLNAKIISTSDTIQGLETELTDTERRLMSLGENEDAVRLSLIARRDILAEVLAALQRLGKRPPPALAVRPSDALSAVRSAILLNAVMPELKVETEALAADLQELQRLKSVIAEEKNRLRGDAMRLAEEKSRLELLLSAKKQEHLKSVEVLKEEKERAAELAEQAGSLQELIANLEVEIESARDAAEKSRQASLNVKRNASRNFDPFADPGRIAPAIAFDDARGRLPQPVAGTMLKGFGQEDEFGGLTEGQSIATRPGSNVTSPADGWVVYSGPFRSFGQLLILNTGDGYHVLLAGLDRIDAELGQFVLTGEPVGVMGATQWASASTFGLGSTQPILYVEFRKDGRAIDPTPWWSRTEEEKARG
ncbi:septal ring factor EnvC (AmiA/AmiB activator) [Labrenzia sp. EL_208]|uniref:murein hydrolase activator EnvC family protein n=1 Tax=Roseibium album TaxID=311410 RepID=UPI001A2747A4|nr:peptidoglycan DD-metalloendopeptidase family protein [Roseibium album]MBG6178638.1 septal ring factor EnvC (AmiA/AmiB activator) [Labrenzia sp. EL_132]MBG6233261.1 septal ring factor EnvC (AmiA/AmiB activator) [Labrenzia sp. EL_208]